MQLTVLVPVYNEANTVVAVLDATAAALAEIDHELIIVDDCSTDGSRELIQNWARDHSDVRVLLHEKNRGKGAAIRSGLDVAGGTYFVVQDADLEYDPTDIGRLLAITDGHKAVYGSRFMGSISGMKVTNRIANRFYNIVLRLLYGVKITDMHTCYKMVPTATLRSFDIQSQGFDYATEVISKLMLSHVPIEELPISYHGRSVEEGKKIGWRDGWDCLRLIVKYRVAGRKTATPVTV